MKTINFKFLLIFVLMLSIASVNVDAQRRRSSSRSRSRSTTTAKSSARLNPTLYECRQMRKNNDIRFWRDLLSLDPEMPASSVSLRKVFKAGNNWNAVIELADCSCKELGMPWYIDGTTKNIDGNLICGDNGWVTLEYNDGNNQRYRVNIMCNEYFRWWVYTANNNPPSYIYVSNGWITKVEY